MHSWSDGRARHAAALMVLLVLPAAALAQLRDDAFRIYGAWFMHTGDAKLRVDGSGVGTEIDLHDDLLVERRDDTYQLGAEWRFAERHRLGVGYFRIDRSGTATLEKDVTIKDITFPAGSSAATNFRNMVVPVTYSYSFYKGKDSEFAGTIGLHWTKLELGVRGQSSTSVAEIDKQASADVAGPLPLLGLRYDYAFTSRWRLLTHAEYFALKIGGSTTYKGSMLNLRAGTEYDIFKNVALGVSYTFFSMDVDADDSDWRGTINYKYYGPALYVVAQF
jgi:hypothetical protein